MEFVAVVLESAEVLAYLRAEWDQLAVDVRRPFSAPAWVLAWWALLQPNGAAMRLVEVRRDDELVGVLPLFACGRDYAPMAGQLAAVEPLAKPGLEAGVAAAMAGALAGLEPQPKTIRLQLREDGVDWAGLLTREWPTKRGAWTRVARRVPVPEVAIGREGFDGWMGAKSSSFRREVRRKEKRLREAGAAFRYATPATLESDVAEFLRLHRTRLSGRGGTSLGDGIEQMLVAVGRELLPSGRFRLLCLDVERRTIAAQALLVAGAETSAWNSGFDEEYGKLSPSMQCMIHALRDAAEEGGETMSLGPGPQPYKARLASGSVDLVSHVIMPRARGYRRARGRMLVSSGSRVARARVGAAIPTAFRGRTRAR
jgi:CelD/BcsL family acetyltransferase involved in cellulose biosynthesis